MNFWYPRIPRRQWRALLGITLTGVFIAGFYGAIHDQVSYTIGPEYFTCFKFYQFAWADLGWPPRLFVAEIGFLASWWAGLFAGWLLGRLGLAEAWINGFRRRVVRTFALVIAITIVGGIAGALVGVVLTYGEFHVWESWRTRGRIQDMRGFVVVACLHWGSYLGAVAGAVVAAIDLYRWRRSLPSAT